MNEQNQRGNQSRGNQSAPPNHGRPPQNQLAQRQQTPAKVERIDPYAELERDVEAMTLAFVQAMPFSVPPQQLARAQAKMKLAFMNTRSDLTGCTPQSVGRAVALSALSGLYPGGHNPDVDIIPRRNKDLGNSLEANWQISWRGYKRLAFRNGYDVEPVLVFRGDVYRITRGSNPTIVHEPAPLGSVERTWETLQGGYVKVYPIGNPAAARFEDLTREQIAQRRRKAQSDTFWAAWPLEMALKTLCRYAGRRELFPCDDQTRYLIHADIETDDDGKVLATALPASSRPPAQAFLPPAQQAFYVSQPAQREQAPPGEQPVQQQPVQQQQDQRGPAQNEHGSSSSDNGGLHASSQERDQESVREPGAKDTPRPPKRYDESAGGTIPKNHASALRSWAKECGLADPAVLGDVMRQNGLPALVELLSPAQQAEFEGAVLDWMQSP